MDENAVRDGDGKNFRVIDIPGLGLCDTAPANTYTALVACSNCGYEGEAQLPKGTTLHCAKCPTCECQYSLEGRHAVAVAVAAAKHKLKLAESQAGHALWRQIIRDKLRAGNDDSEPSRAAAPRAFHQIDPAL